MSRDDRNRLIDLHDGIDLRDRGGPITTQRMLTQVYDGGAIPTTVPKVYLTHPVLADAADTEGASYSMMADAAITIPVVVLGPKVPVAGDLLVAHAIAGRWLAGDGGGSKPGTLCCFPCPIPKRNLKLGNPDGSGGQLTLTFTPPNGPWNWNDAPGDVAIEQLDCSDGTLTYFHQDIGIDPGASCNIITSFTCSPFVVTFFCLISGTPIGATIYDPTPDGHDISDCVVVCPPCNLPRRDMLLGGHYGFATLFYHAGPPAYWETNCFPLPNVDGSSIKVRVFCDPENGSSITTSIYTSADCTGTPTETTYGPPASSTCGPLHLDWDIGGGNHLFADYP